MKRKELVKVQGKWIEAYVDKGPARPSTMTRGNGTPNRRIDGKRNTGRQA